MVLKDDLANYYCQNAGRDLFTTSDAVIGNKALTYPIGLITADEITFAGANRGNNKNFYLYDYTYRTMTPSLYGSISQTSDVLTFLFAGNIYSYGVDTNVFVKTVISLKSDVEISGGIGTVNEPFIIKTE